MKKIKDERLVMQNLKNIRTAFIIQTIGIIAILVFIAITKGILEAVSNPIWVIFMITMIVLGWANFSYSVDVYDHLTDRKKRGSYYRVIGISLIVGTVFGLLAKFGPDQTSNSQALLAGSVVFACFLVTFTIGYLLVKKRLEDSGE